jgi:hypothetical protein
VRVVSGSDSDSELPTVAGIKAPENLPVARDCGCASPLLGSAISMDNQVLPYLCRIREIDGD